MEEWEDALRILEGDDQNNFSAVGKPKQKRPIRKLTTVETIDWGMTSAQIESRLHLLLGKVPHFTFQPNAGNAVLRTH